MRELGLGRAEERGAAGDGGGSWNGGSSRKRKEGNRAERDTSGKFLQTFDLATAPTRNLQF